jgi:hypothetical protein
LDGRGKARRRRRGGYLFLLAKDAEAASRIRSELAARPPNPRARFVWMGIPAAGRQVTRS